jgi:hypothetical protein
VGTVAGRKNNEQRTKKNKQKAVSNERTEGRRFCFGFLFYQFRLLKIVPISIILYYIIGGSTTGLTKPLGGREQFYI